MSLVDALLAPFSSSGLFVELIWQFSIFLLIAISLDLVMGYTGMFQLGHIGFFALGAMGTTMATHPDWLGLDMFSGILLGMAMTAIAAVLIGIPTLRLSGDYFAIATFGFTLSVQAVLLGYWATGIFGVPGPNPFGCDPACLAGTQVGHAVGMAFGWVVGLGTGPNAVESGIELAILAFFVVGAYALIGRLKRAPLGRVLKSIREDRRAAMSMGKDVQMFRFKALIVSALVQSLAGSLWAHHVRNLGPNFYGFQLLILTLIAVILGGLGSHLGALVGAFLFVLINEESKSLAQWFGATFPEATADFDLASLRLVLFGALLVALMILRPQGILGDREYTVREGLVRIKARLTRGPVKTRMGGDRE